ncbi:hypothetical protein GQ42DRAFT_162870 [Ramicandelaber brevisporus]|nr:hypothetical protein GQ42DRAFT_162870 [Ramicandelaber brevisporus]
MVHGFCKMEGKGCQFDHERAAAYFAGGTASPPAQLQDWIKPTRGKGAAVSIRPPTSALSPSAAATAAAGTTTVAISASNSNSGGVAVSPVKMGENASAAANDGNERSASPSLATLMKNKLVIKDFVPRNKTTSNLPTATSTSLAPVETAAEVPSIKVTSPKATKAASNVPESERPSPSPVPSPEFHLTQHLYMPPAPPGLRLGSAERTVHDFFMPDRIRHELLERVTEPARFVPGTGSDALPSLLQYHSLVYVGESSSFAASGGSSGNASTMVSIMYNAISSTDGYRYTLRRFPKTDITFDAATLAATVAQWRNVQHPGVVKLHEVFTTHAFGDKSVVFVYDYYPNMRKLSTILYGDTSGKKDQQQSQPQQLSTTQIWSIITQLLCIIRAIHSAGLALRAINLESLVFSGPSRIRFDHAGVVDVLSGPTGSAAMAAMSAGSSVDSALARERSRIKPNLLVLQSMDLFAVGQLIIAIVCKIPVGMTLQPAYLAHISQNSTPDMVDLVTYLMSCSSGPPSNSANPIQQVTVAMSKITQRFADQVEYHLDYTEVLEGSLARELENGRLFRLITKINHIVERPEFEHDPEWSETGDRYIIKLFRDYVFHQVDGNTGRAVVDMAHVVSCLNKLDAGIKQPIALVSRDERSYLVVTYEDLKRVIDQSFNSLLSRRS